MTGFEVLGTRSFHRPLGEMTFQQGVELVARGLAHARALELDDILVDTTGLAGFEPPCVFDRYAMITRWVKCAGLALRIAVVTRPPFIDAQRLGVLIAQNRGASIEVFTGEAQALRWLDAWRLRSAGARCARGRACGY